MSTGGERVGPALTWRPIQGYEGLYEVSESGAVRRLAGVDSLGRPRRERMLRRTDDGRGYLVVSLSKNDRAKVYRVHRLVARAWLGEAEDGHVVNHIDGDKRNNHRQNLEYCTQQANDRHAVEHGLKACGERHGLARLTAARAEQMRQRFVVVPNKMQVGREFGVSARTVQRVVEGKSWSR